MQKLLANGGASSSENESWPALVADEWSKYFRLDMARNVEALHARFITHRYSRHVHEYFVIGLVEIGAQSYRYRGSTHVTPAGQIFFVNPDEPHTGESACCTGYLYRTLCLSTSYFEYLAENISTRPGSLRLKGAVIGDPILAATLFRFHRSLSAYALSAERELLLLQSVRRLVTNHTDAAVPKLHVGKEHRAVSLACEYMASHFYEDVSLATLSSVVSLSSYYFARAFERQNGIPPHAYLDSVRIRKACQYLDQGKTIGATALLVGYADQSHLTRRFKRHMGITPGRYVSKDSWNAAKDRLSGNIDWGTARQEGESCHAERRSLYPAQSQNDEGMPSGLKN